MPRSRKPRHVGARFCLYTINLADSVCLPQLVLNNSRCSELGSMNWPMPYLGGHNAWCVLQILERTFCSNCRLSRSAEVAAGRRQGLRQGRQGEKRRRRPMRATCSLSCACMCASKTSPIRMPHKGSSTNEAAAADALATADTSLQLKAMRSWDTGRNFEVLTNEGHG